MRFEIVLLRHCRKVSDGNSGCNCSREYNEEGGRLGKGECD